MNRPRLPALTRVRHPLSGPLGTVLSLLIGGAALMTVGPVLGRGLEPTARSADLVAVTAGASGEQTARDGFVGALSAALRGLAGGRSDENEVVARAAPPGVVELPFDASSGESVVRGDPALPAPSAPEARSVERASDLLPAAPVPAAPAFTPDEVDRETVEPEDVPAAVSSMTTTESASPPPSQSVPIPAPTPPPALVAPTARVQPTRRVAPTSVRVNPTQRPRASATPKPTMASAPTRIPTAVPSVTPRVQREAS